MMSLCCAVMLLMFTTLAQINEQEYKWGTYKPQLVHAITERNLQSFNPFTLVFYYFLNAHVKWEKSIKYKVSELTPNILYDYVAHDAENFAMHQIHDREYQLALSNEFYKIDQDWVSSVTNMNPLNGDAELVSLVYSFALEKLNTAITDLRRISIVEDGASIKVILDDLSASTIYLYVTLLVDGQVEALPGNSRFGFALMHQNPSLNWNCRHALYEELRKCNLVTPQSYQLGQDFSSQEQGNLLFIQYVARRNENFHLQVRYSTQQLKNGYYYDVRALKKQTLTKYNERFQSIFLKHDFILNDFHLKCAKSSFSNLMGGYVLAYGDLHCDKEESCSQPKMMLTMTPSRRAFPRPFLWDDGFHNMLACKWNPQLCLQSLMDWFDTMTDDGWIPREQARGDEARSFFPAHQYGYKLTQTRKENNPPTFVFNFLQLEMMAKNDPHMDKTIHKLWPKLKTWYNFWFKSQGVPDLSMLFKWWGPNENVNFGSGMDDWPRSIYGFIGRYNVDASAWAWFFASSMEKLSRTYEPNLTKQFRLTAQSISKAMNQKLLDPSDLIYKDLLVTNARVKVASFIFSPHIGYPNLLPFAFGMIEDTVVLHAHLDLLKSDELWSQFGIRSLSKFDEHFGKGDNYWRGPIWIPINYLILRALYKFYSKNPYAVAIYTELRENIINLVCSNWRDTGLFFEHYNQRLDGQGQGHTPFNGCTSLITLIIAENYD